MIVVTGVVEIDAEHVWPATTAAAKLVDATEREDGCISYRFSVDILNPRRFRLYEEWRDEAALAAHLKTPHVAEFQKRLKSFRIIERRIVKYEVGEATPL